MVREFGETAFAPRAERTEFGGGMVAVDLKVCQGCTLCAMVCPAGFLEILEVDGKKRSHVRGGAGTGQDNCMACACCEAICEPGAIKLTLPYDHGGEYKQLERGELSLPRAF